MTTISIWLKIVIPVQVRKEGSRKCNSCFVLRGEKLEVSFEIDKYAKYPMNRYEGTFNLERTPKLVENIKEYYKDDMEKFYDNL